jgi:hypothetical protein
MIPATEPSWYNSLSSAWEDNQNLHKAYATARNHNNSVLANFQVGQSPMAIPSILSAAGLALSTFSACQKNEVIFEAAYTHATSEPLSWTTVKLNQAATSCQVELPKVTKAAKVFTQVLQLTAIPKIGSSQAPKLAKTLWKFFLCANWCELCC